jgi:precorrin-6B methylase 2
MPERTVNPTWTREDILGLARSYQSACVLAAGVEHDLFTLLAGEGRTAADAARAVEGDERAVDAVLHALAALGLLRKEGERFRTPEDVAQVLDGTRPGNVLAMARHQANCLRRWAELSRVVRDGGPPHVAPSVRGEEADLASFIEAMHDVSGPVADEVVADLGPFDFDALLDLGGATGTWTAAWLRRAPSARAIVFDRPEVIPMARRRMEEEGLLDRVSLAGGDYHAHELPGPVDLAWLSAIIHQNSHEQNRALYRRVFAALRPGGRVLIRDIVMEEDRTQPASGALFAVNMLVGTEAGGTYAFGSTRSALEEAGFGAVRVVRPDPAMNAVIEATRPTS